MKSYFQKLIFSLLCLYSVITLAVTAIPVKLEHVDINIHNQASLLRGAKFFASNCMSCHTMKYLTHNKLATKAGITLDKMPLKNKEWWLGVVPPDLTLITIQRGPKWVYTYLNSFYRDAKRPTGYNNLLVQNVNMTNVLVGLQGQQVLSRQGEYALAHPRMKKKLPYYTLLRLEKSGSLSPEQFDQTMTDLVNFLVYASEPAKLQREQMGWWVLLFLAVLFTLAWLLKKAYWKDIK